MEVGVLRGGCLSGRGGGVGLLFAVYRVKTV